MSERALRAAAELRGELHPKTIEYLRSTDARYRKKLGQFFTPRSLREELLSKLPRLSRPRVVDPACGTGEFLLSAREYFVDPELHCWDVDERVLEVAKEVLGGGVRYEVVDSLSKPFVEEFDVVLGNPPYFEFEPDPELASRYREVIGGRVNVYSLFIYLGLRILKPGGYLAYVVSSSMNSGAYFSRLREYILKVADIEYLRVIPDPHIFGDANHTFQLLVLRKRHRWERPSASYTFSLNGRTVFTEHAEELREIWRRSVSLGELGYRVVTGRVVWNQHKDELTWSQSEGVLLIWAHNIKNGRLVLYNNPRKPQYIRWKGQPDVGPAIVVRRVIGHPGNPKLEAALVPPGLEFVAENHVNVVWPPPEAGVEELKTIVEVLNSEATRKYVSMVVGNTQVSARELENLLPVPRSILELRSRRASGRPTGAGLSEPRSGHSTGRDRRGPHLEAI